MDDEASNANEPGLRITRRRLIQAGVVAGGAVWVAPTVDSLVSVAAASSPAPNPAGTCTSGGNIDVGFSTCNPNEASFNGLGCFCFTDIDTGGPFCGNNTFCDSTSTCSKDSDCPPGWICASDTACGNVCVPPCGVDPPAGSGPTAAAA